MPEQPWIGVTLCWIGLLVLLPAAGLMMLTGILLQQMHDLLGANLLLQASSGCFLIWCLCVGTLVGWLVWRQFQSA